jgi:hypothetical protein
MRIAAIARGAAKVRHRLLWIGVGIFGLMAVYLVIPTPPSQAVSDRTVWPNDEARCARFGFPVGTQENFFCVIDLRGAGSYPLEIGTHFP